MLYTLPVFVPMYFAQQTNVSQNFSSSVVSAAIVSKSVVNFCSAYAFLTVLSRSHDLLAGMWLACLICIYRTPVAPRYRLKFLAGTSTELFEHVDSVSNSSGDLLSCENSSTWISFRGPGWSSGRSIRVFLIFSITLCNSFLLYVSCCGS